MSPIAIFALFGAFLALVFGGRAMYERRRRDALQQYCQERGYRFERERPGAATALAAEFPIFTKGHGQTWSSTVTGTVGGNSFTAFEYVYITGYGRNRQTHKLGMMYWETPGTNLPRFSCGPEGFWRRIAQRFGAQDFDFAEDEAFSRAYELQGDDEAAVRALFTPSRRMFLVSAGPDGTTQRQHVAGAGTRLLWWRAGRLPGPQELDQFIADGERVRRMFTERS